MDQGSENPLSAEQQMLRLRVGEVLHYLWDPVGVANAPAARDEYDSYVLPVLGLLLRGAKVDTIADHLVGIERDAMELEPHRQRAIEVAALLVRWRKWEMDGEA